MSPSVIVQEKRAATVRALAMNPPAPSSRKRVPSPAAIRQNAANPPPPTTKVNFFQRLFLFCTYELLKLDSISHRP